MVQTVAFGGVVPLAGYGLRRLVPILARLNLPAPVLGGLCVSLAVWAARSNDLELVRFDTELQSPLMIAFFTTVGFGASLSLLKIGGPQVVRFFALATVFAVAQNVVGILLALGFGLHPLFGVLAVGLAHKLDREVNTTIAIIGTLIAMFFAYRSFYGMRIDSDEKKS